MIKFGFSLLLLLLPSVLLAQFTPDPDWRFENFNNQNHFISSEAGDLTIDKHGYVWVSNRGIQRFDGYRTINFNSFSQVDGGLRDNFTDVTTDSSGRVWVSSAGLCYYDEVSGKFIYVPSDNKHNINIVYSFLSHKNNLWFVSNYGLTKLDTRSLHISFTSLQKVVDPLGAFLIDENTLLVSSREKVYTYNIKYNTYITNTLTYNNALVKIFSVAKNKDQLYLGANTGLYILKNLNGIPQVTNILKNIIVNDLTFLPQDKEKKYLFLATENDGVIIYNTVLKKIEVQYTHDDANPGSLSHNTINKFYIDKNKRLWISTVSGASMLDLNNQDWKIRFLGKSGDNELSINKILADKYDSSKVWMSSYNNGLACLNWNTNTIEKTYSITPKLEEIHDFAQLSHDKWLLVTQNEIIEWSAQSGIFQAKKLPIPDSLGLYYNIHRIIMADINNCFITTNKGLFKYNATTHQISNVLTLNINKKSDIPKDDILKYNLQNGFYDNGALWIASRNGLLNYDLSTQKATNYTEKKSGNDYFLFDVARAPGNQLVCASLNGIVIFNKQTKSFKVINSVANFFKPDCVGVICANNKVWIDSEAGILSYDLITHKSAISEKENPLMQIFPGAPFTIIKNNVVVGFRNGYAYFKPDVKNVLLPSGPVIERVDVNNQPVFFNCPNQKKEGGLVLKYDDNSINIAFTAFLYTDPNSINFRYKLKGADAKWQYIEDQRSANYAQLPPGDYTFYVQSGNKNGAWNSRLASFSFKITPPYWETWWFRALIILLIALGLYNYYRYRIKHLLAIERIREKIASDFHDDIGSALSSISIFSEVADSQLKQQMPHDQIREIIGHISFYSRAMLDSMDDIVWMVNPQNDYFNDLAVRMREFAIPLLEAKNINFEINIKEEILNTKIKMEARKNIFLIFKESINNILKHSQCLAMTVSIGKINNQLELIISDNGKGFDLNSPSSRNGLKNMQKRASEINGKIVVTSEPDKGTVIRLLVNIT